MTGRQQHDRRRRRRHALYLVGLLPSLLLLLLSLRIVLMLTSDARGHESYAAGAYGDARDDFARNRVLNPFQRWIAPFNEGDARYRLADHAGAVEAFEEALTLAPPGWQCPVRINLALAHEGVGDARVEDGDRPEAEAAWLAGRAALRACLRTNGTDEARARVVDARLEEKLGDVVAPAGHGQQPPPADESVRARERRVEARNQQGREERRRLQGQEEAPPRRSDEPDW